MLAERGMHMPIPETDLKVGLLVENRTRGLGKVVATERGYVYVYFLDQDETDEAIQFKLTFAAANFDRPQLQTHEELDLLPRFVKIDGSYRIEKISRTFPDALASFRKLFPAGFSGDDYVSDERDYKVAASDALVNAFGNGRGLALLKEGRVEEVVARALTLETTNLAHPRWEKPRIAQALRDLQVANAYFEAVFQLADAKTVTPPLFDALALAVETMKSEMGPIARWPATTVFLALLRPDRFLFFRPTQTGKAASLVGVSLGYKPAPNWKTYEAVLKLAANLMERLGPLGARDLLDVQTFIFLTLSGG